MVWQIAGPGRLLFSGPNGVADRWPGLAFFCWTQMVCHDPTAAMYKRKSIFDFLDRHHVAGSIETRYGFCFRTQMVGREGV
jgi:hypothetical protein